MHRQNSLLSGSIFFRVFPSFLLSLWLVSGAAPLFADIVVEYEVIARSGVTTVPGSTVKFNGFGVAPAIDKQGNVVFTGGGTGRFGVYTALGGTCCQIAADNFTPLPGGGGATFYDFSGAERHDIDNGRVAFKAKSSLTRTALYSNVGQASASTLVEVTALDNVEWSVLGDPWVDGNTVGIYGNRLIPSSHYAIMLWNGATGGESFVNPGTGYNVGYNSQASLAGNAAILARAKTGSFQMGISSGSTFEVLATANQTVMPDLGVVFTNFYAYPVVDDGGQDAAFVGYGNPNQGLFKRVNGGALQNVVDNTTPVPSSGGHTFTILFESAMALANGQVLFGGMGQSPLKGVYTDVGGALAVLFDNGLNSSIVVGGQTLEVSNFDFGTRSFAYTPQGYMAVFQVSLATGGSAIIRATVDDGTRPPGTFTVYKDFSDNNTVSVSMTASCTGATVTNSPQVAREGVPAVFNVTGATGSTTCTATEPAVPSGYTRNQTDCQNGDPLNGSCTIVNTLNTTAGTFTVNKDFSNNSTASVSITATCSSGTVTNSPQLASEATPAVFNVTGALAGATCTATEPTVPTGYTRNQTDCQNGDPLNGSCTIVNTLNTASSSFTVYKDFSDTNTASVSITASCTSGTVTNSPQLASEASPAVFSISGATAGATCTATEPTIPSGYTRNQTDCQNAKPLNGSCIIVNTRIPTAQQTVFDEDFEDGNANGWSTSGTVDVNGEQSIGLYALRLRRSSTAEIGVSTLGISGVSVEMRVAGTSLEDAESCFAELSTNGGSSWTTVVQVTSSNANGGFFTGVASPTGASNNSNLRLRFRSTGAQTTDNCWGDEVIVSGTTTSTTAGSFVVRKDFSDNNTANVTVSLSCTSGTVTNSPRTASEASPAVFYIQGQSTGATCSASESPVPSGYTANQSGCQDGDPVNGACTIVNTLNQTGSGTFTVHKDFSDTNTANVSITVTCTSGTVTNSPQTAREGLPAVFNITGATAGTTCTANEPTVPAGYTRNQTDCQNGDPLNGSCTIVNTLNSNTFTVNKDFSDGNPASVSVTLSCTSGTIAINPKLASEGTPAVFNISGATTGATCTATEPTIPSGYTRNQTDCQNGDPLNGSCTIVNTLISNPETVILNSNFETGLATGWTSSGDVAIDTATAIGQYSLRHVNNGASATRTVSTTGYNSVSVSMKLAGQSLEGNDSCFAEISTNGGSSWTQVLSLSSSNANGTFLSGTVAPAAASNNSNLRLRARMTGSGKGDNCWLDDVMVVGTASGSSAQSAENSLQALSVSVTEPEASTFGVGTMSDDGPVASGFDPGFDQLVGSGKTIRRQLRYDELMGGSDRLSPPRFGAFGIPAGAGQPSAYFSGALELRGVASVGQSDLEVSASPLQSLPEFSFDFVQVGNHLFPVGSSVASTGSSGFDYVIDTGRVWREASDNGFSRATIPFMLAQLDGNCVYNGRLTFLFKDGGTTSRAAYQVTGSACGDAPEFTLWGSADALYTPATTGLGATDIGSVLDCAAQNWLPLTIGHGGMTMVLTPDGRSHYVLNDAETSLSIDAADTGSAVDALCR